jgi:hypothetical protein
MEIRRSSGINLLNLRHIAALPVLPTDTMSTTADLVTAIKKELKAAQMTYADLARP